MLSLNSGIMPIASNWIPLEKPSVLLELFTSQGCSSCPPADALLAKLHQEAEVGGLPLVALSFHVDYWNRLGWKDPYSQAQFSDRQRTYAKKLQSLQVYTPQLVVNGQSGHIGSREQEVRKAILKQKKPKQEGIVLKIDNRKNGNFSFYYQIDDKSASFTLNVALVRPSVGNTVSKGENRGRTLKHVQVVMAFKSQDLTDSSGVVQIDFSESLIDKEDQIVCFLQRTDTWAVEGIQVFGQIN